MSTDTSAVVIAMFGKQRPRRGAFGHVDDVALLVKIRTDRAAAPAATCTTVIAALIDSCMTSPSLPVNVVFALPGTLRHGLDRQQLSADFEGPREAGHLTNLLSFSAMPKL